MGKIKKFFKTYWGSLALLALIIFWYEYITDITHTAPKLIFPGFSEIIPNMIDSIPEILEGLLSSLGLLIPGYLLAALAGIALGTLIAFNPWLRRTLQPFIYALNPIPPVLYIPYAIAIASTFWLASEFIIFIGCFWPFLNGTINGILMIEQKYLDNAKVLELRGIKLFTNVIFPAASPIILSGASTSLNMSFLLLTVAEMFAAKSGLGYFIIFYRDFADYTRVLGGIIFMAFVIIIFMTLFDRLKRKLLFWTLNEKK